MRNIPHKTTLFTQMAVGILITSILIGCRAQTTSAPTASPGETAVSAPVEPTPTPTQSATPAPSKPENPNYLDPTLPIEQRVDDLLAYMTLEEKFGQMTLIDQAKLAPGQVTSYALGGVLSGGGGHPRVNSATAWAEMVDGFQQEALDTRLGIPILYGVDAIHGHANVYGATIFPQNIAMGAANDPALMTAIGAATARELAATGIYWDYAPILAVTQDIRWGRTYESFSEDTALVSALGTAYLVGLQGDDLADADTVMGTIKHFVGDGGTTWGTGTNGYRIDRGSTEVDEATLRTLHLPPYQAAIEAGARSLMVSYSSWGGVKMHGQRYLIQDVLRGEMGFDGLIVSDWAGIDAVNPNYDSAIVTAINAGLDMNMVPSNARRFIDSLRKAVENGDIPLERIDQAVRHILTVKFELGLFERPFSNPELLPSVGSDKHRQLARQAVRQSLVLLKNEKTALPLSKEAGLLYVAGAAADDIGMQSGGWTIEWQGKSGDITPGTTLLQAITSTVSAETRVIYNKNGDFTGDETADACLVAVHERPYAEGQGDSSSLLPDMDMSIFERMEGRCQKMIVVLISGRPLIISEQIDRWDAVVAAWLPGSEGQGVVDVLFGDQPFRGKLPFTWPRSVEQLPFDFQNIEAADPLFPFGFGLGY